MKDNGFKVKCTGRENTYGRVGRSIKVVMLKIEEKGKVLLNGQTDENTQDLGKMENNTD